MTANSMTSDGALRSSRWFGASGRSGMAYRGWMRSQGFTPEVFDGRPVIGIATTWSELAPCNVHLHRVAESVKRGVWQAGGFPLEFPAMALGETMLRPTAMLYRNLLAMEAEELMRANPLDGVVLLSGCDKTTPGLLMAAASVDLPAVMVTGGPMLNGKYQGTDVGSGTAVWRFEEDLVAGRMTQEECVFAEGCMARSNGHCMTMGTASTMASMAEALGMQQAVLGQLAHDRRQAAGVAEVLHQVLAARLQVQQGRDVPGQHVEVVERERHAEAACDGQQVDHRVRRAADRRVDPDRVLERRPGHDGRGSQVVPDQADDDLAGSLRRLVAAGVHRGPGRRVRQLQAERLGH